MRVERVYVVGIDHPNSPANGRDKEEAELDGVATSFHLLRFWRLSLHPLLHAFTLYLHGVF